MYKCKKLIKQNIRGIIFNTVVQVGLTDVQKYLGDFDFRISLPLN